MTVVPLVGKAKPALLQTKTCAALRSDGSESITLENMDLRADGVDPNESGDEDVGDTSAEKRLHLAKLYSSLLERTLVRSFTPISYHLGVLTPVSLGLADGEADAAEVDKELISARLKDVLEYAGKLHLFVADSVSALVAYNDCVCLTPSSPYSLMFHNLYLRSGVGVRMRGHQFSSPLPLPPMMCASFSPLKGGIYH